MTSKTEKKPEFDLRLERVVDAPRERVWQAWADPEQMKRWFAPRPYQLGIKSMDLRTGGSFDMSMTAPDGTTHAFGGRYVEVVPQKKIVWTGEFPGDPKGNIRTEVTFEEQGRKTKVTAHQTFAVVTEISEVPTSGAKQGWTMTLDQLAETVERA